MNYRCVVVALPLAAIGAVAQPNPPTGSSNPGTGGPYFDPCKEVPVSVVVGEVVLTRADLRDADRSGAILEDADLTGAWLGDANLRGAIDLDAADLEGADLGGTILPCRKRAVGSWGPCLDYPACLKCLPRT